jgi:AraC-like DNA-binding protein
LPDALVVRDLEPALIALFAEEMDNDEPGQAAIVDRLIDLLVVRCVRTVPASSSGASRDVRVGRALRHRGAPRTPVDRRVPGDAGRYLPQWRLTLAADLLVSTDKPLAAVAAKVGYADAFAISAAFKRVHGESRRENRDSHTV